MQQRRRFKQTESLKDRLVAFANDALKKASEMQPSRERDDLIKNARRAETAAHIDEWINSTGLQPPK